MNDKEILARLFAAKAALDPSQVERIRAIDGAIAAYEASPGVNPRWAACARVLQKRPLAWEFSAWLQPHLKTFLKLEHCRHLAYHRLGYEHAQRAFTAYLYNLSACGRSHTIEACERRGPDGPSVESMDDIETDALDALD